jgi:hypothetical protein
MAGKYRSLVLLRTWTCLFIVPLCTVKPWEWVCLPASLKACLKTMDIFEGELIRSTGSGYFWNMGNIFINVLLSAIITLNQGFSAFIRQRTKFTLVYWSAGHNVINEDNLLKLHGNLLTMLLTYCYKQAHISLLQNQSLVRHTTLLLLA